MRRSRSGVLASLSRSLLPLGRLRTSATGTRWAARRLARPVHGPTDGPTDGSRAEPAPGIASEVVVDYSPRTDGQPDPGEVVWAWVPYDDDPRRGKDRPVLVIGRRGGALVGLMLSSKDHDLDAADEAAHGRHWMDVGSGGWDRDRRPSEVRLDRLVELPAGGVRREGAALDRRTFEHVIQAARRFHPLADGKG